MTNRYNFEPVTEVAAPLTLMVPSTLTVYASRAVPGAVSVCMGTGDGYIDAGTRLTKEQVGDLIHALADLIGEPIGTASYDQGYAEGKEEGYRVGYDDGYGEGDSEGWENGYQLGFERGVEGGDAA